MTPLDRQVLRLAIPNLLAVVSVPLVGIADTAMVGRFLTWWRRFRGEQWLKIFVE